MPPRALTPHAWRTAGAFRSCRSCGAEQWMRLGDIPWAWNPPIFGDCPGSSDPLDAPAASPRSPVMGEAA